MRVGVLNDNFLTWLKINFKTLYFLLGFNLLLGAVSLLFTFSRFQGQDQLVAVYLGGQVLPGSDPVFSPLIFQYWRFITSAFLHGGLIHLLFNMYALNAVGGFIERFYGGRKLFAAYIFTAITASLLSFGGGIFETWQNQGAQAGLAVSVGASGAIFGLIGVILGNRFLRKHTYDPEINLNYNDLIFIVVINLVLGFSVNLLGTGILINNWAHVGGLIGGLILGAIFDTKNTFDSPRFKKILEQVLFFLAVVLFIAAWIFNLISISSWGAGFIR